MKKTILILALSIPAFGQIALVDHKAATGTGANTITSPALNCTGANFIAACAVVFTTDCTTATVSDPSNGNWTLHGSNFALNSPPGNNSNVCLWWKENATVTSSQAITVALTAAFPSVAGACFSGVKTSSSHDQETGAAWNGANSTQQPGALTPSAANALLLSCGGMQDTGASGGNITVSGSSYTTLDTPATSGAVNQAIGSAYVVQTTATSANPTWNVGTTLGTLGGGVCQESFFQSTGATKPPGQFPRVN